MLKVVLNTINHKATVLKFIDMHFLNVKKWFFLKFVFFFCRCAICMCEFVMGEALRFLPCMHVYHKDCIDDWLMRSFTCPSCMEPVDAALLTTYETNWPYISCLYLVLKGRWNYLFKGCDLTSENKEGFHYCFNQRRSWRTWNNWMFVLFMKWELGSKWSHKKL